MIDVIDYIEDSDNGPATLRVLLDPEAKRNLIELGFISSLKRSIEEFEESLKK
jgi:hypothetical protein